MASSIMSQLDNVWRQQRLSLSTKLRIYSLLMQSVALYGCETWTLCKVDNNRIQSFRMPAGTASYSGRVTRSQMLQSRRERSYLIYRLSSLIDAIRCLVTFVVSQALQLSVDAHTGTPAADWKRQPGRPRRTSLQQVKQDCGIFVSLAEITSQDRSLWRSLRPSAGQAQQ